MVKVVEGYLLDQIIGEGGFSTVFKATHKQKPGVYAVKVVPVEKIQENSQLEMYMNNEVEALQTIGINEYIIRFYELIKTKNNRYMVYEYCQGGTLKDFMRVQSKLDQKRALCVFRQILEALKVLNKNNIMHRDLKPENIFLASEGKSKDFQIPSASRMQKDQNNQKYFNKKIKLGDFGFCKGLKPNQNLTKTMLGSPIYMAPQVLKGEPYTTKADIWSLGVILFEMLYGYCPFESKNIYSLINTIENSNLQLPTDVQVSERTQNILKRMLVKDYFRRMGWAELFGQKINENGEYINENDENEPEQKVKYPSIFGSQPLQPVSGLVTNVRSYSTIKDEKTQKNVLNGFHYENRLQDAGATRVSSQPKDKKVFYSQNFINILNSPCLSKQTQFEDTQQEQKMTIEQNPNKVSQKQQKNQQIVHQITAPLITPPCIGSPTLIGSNKFSPPSRKFQQLLESSQSPNTDFSLQVNQTGSRIFQSIPFNKYRESLGLGSTIKITSERNVKQQQIKSTNLGSAKAVDSSGELDIKRNSILKTHDGIVKITSKIMCILQDKFNIYKISKDNSNEQLVIDFLQDCYIVLKILESKLKSLTEMIKITETTLLDISSFVSIEKVMIQKFIEQIIKELQKCQAEVPVLSSTSGDKKDSQMIKNKYIVQIIQDAFN